MSDKDSPKKDESVLPSGSASKFESAVDAIVAGDAAGLELLLRENRNLTRERSTRSHRATLLNYVGANGVEDYRQKTPKNAVKLAGILLKADADVHAVADTYGGSDTLGLAATSVHPFLAGVQEGLIDILVEHGASLREERLVNGCLANGRFRAAQHLAELGAALDLDGACGIGRLNLVRNYFNEDCSLTMNATRGQMDLGFLWACEYGRTDVVEFLLKMGIKLDAMPRGATGLHWGAYGGHADIVRLLLEKKPPVDPIDRNHRGTPLGWALHGWGSPPLEAGGGRYYEVVALLVAAGAKVDPGWLAKSKHPTPLPEKIHADPPMLSALKGESAP